MLRKNSILEDKPQKTIRAMVQRFMERYRLTLRVPNLLKFIKEDLRDKISLAQVLNMDQVGVFSNSFLQSWSPQLAPKNSK